VKEALKKFSRSKYQHFNIMIRLQSPKTKQETHMKSKMLKESLLKVVGCPI